MQFHSERLRVSPAGPNWLQGVHVEFCKRVCVPGLCLSGVGAVDLAGIPGSILPSFPEFPLSGCILLVSFLVCLPGELEGGSSGCGLPASSCTSLLAAPWAFSWVCALVLSPTLPFLTLQGASATSLLLKIPPGDVSGI